MNPAVLPTLSRGHLRDLAECPRRFWLRHVKKLVWPADPLPPAVEEALAAGQAFHQLMQRHFLGLDPAAPTGPLADWWRAWQQNPPPLPPGRRLPELTLTVPLGPVHLLARFDLLVLADDENDGTALIVDYKTEHRPRSAARLAADLQSRVYPFVLAQGGSSLTGGRPIPPEAITLLYWQANAPAQPVRLPYSAEQHAANRSYFESLIAVAESLDPAVAPPLIDDLAICARCPFRSYCRPQLPAAPDDDPPPPEPDPDLAPPA